MDLLIAILFLVGQVVIEVLKSPVFIITYLLLFAIVAWQYWRLEGVTRSLFDYSHNHYLKSALISSGLGLIGGVLGSVLLILVGIDLSRIGIIYLWFIAVFLMLINPRFLCFAYAAGILSLISLATGFPHINIPQLIGLVAILHMIESILIYLNGNINPVPVYIKRNNNLRGGFNLQNFWPLPFIALIASGWADPAAGISMPDWWPLIKDNSLLNHDTIYTLLPVLAVLGYGEICSTSPPEQRVKKSSRNLFSYSLILLLLAIFSSYWEYITIIAALFSPLGHELIIWLGMRQEIKQAPIYIKPPRGVMVLAVKDASLANRAGIRSGDIILNINDEPVNDNKSMQDYLACGWRDLELGVLREGKRLTFRINRNIQQELGIIPVPDNSTAKYLSLNNNNFSSFIRTIRNRMGEKFDRKKPINPS